MELREALRMLRSEVGLTQVEFAAAVYVSFSTVSRWENKGMRPSRIQSKTILELAKQHRVSTACLEALTKCLLASRADDKADKARQEQVSNRIKSEQRDLLTAEQFRKTMDHIDMAMVGQRFYDGNPSSCDIFYHNSYFVKTLGYSFDEVERRLRHDPLFCIAQEYRKAFLQQIKELLSGKTDVQDFSLLTKAVRKDGTTLWLEVKAASLTAYSYGQELFTTFRDVTQRVEAEQKYNEEVLLRDVSMQVMFSNLHCDLTENVITRHYNLKAMLGVEYGGETLDQILRLVADAAPDGAEKSRFLSLFNRRAFFETYQKGNLYGNVTLYNRYAKRWFRNEYLLIKNPVNGHIHALIYIFDIQQEVISQKVLTIVMDKFFEYVGLIDAETEMVESYYYAENTFEEQYAGKRYYPDLCRDKLLLYGDADAAADESEAIALPTIRARLDKAQFYSTVLHMKTKTGQPIQKKVTYCYLDEARDTIIVAQSDTHALERFTREVNRR